MTLKKQLLEIQYAITMPDRLESVSQIFGFGLDSFGATVSPSRSFDELGTTFNKAQLIITLTLLSVALVLTRSQVSVFFSSSRVSHAACNNIAPHAQVNEKQLRRKWY
jgi:hypothetical protein